ncbi:MAG: Kynurenine formamidase, bacterial [uncultured Sphingomonadaceae bacterium]|uniref:Kynurenine formamidase, bacterial n=1 Tax=uncultured Sphingomonadaceae bacterium TaxID=169976 RepID=A0A6J4S759_9SPHN|nr:MAG: Kynurenine formamidase, bacterial [uncultured Sphingomonadaceae bacterium]
MEDRQKRFVDLSHVIEAGMTTFKGLPGPQICDYWTREALAAGYDDGSSFQIGRIDMVANTSTYVDAPFHRYADGKDLTGLDLASLASLDAVVVRRLFEDCLASDVADLEGLDVRGKAVLVHTGWDRYWGTDAYFADHPYLTGSAARRLVEAGAAFIGINSRNIDDTRTRARPVHTILLGADVPVGKHLTNPRALPDRNFRFSAILPKVAGIGTFPVRAYAELP